MLKERGILTQKEVSLLLNSMVESPYYRLAVLLGVLCGMRRGEIRGLQWNDIQEGYIDLKHNFQDSA